VTAILSLSLGAALGIIFTIAYERYAKPTIVVSIGDKADGVAHRFVHLDVTNKYRTGFIGFIKGNRVAEFVKVRVSALDPATNSLVVGYIGRWSSKAEPIDSKNGIFGTFNPALAIDAESEILLPGERKSLTIALKHEGSNHFCGFNNGSYRYDKWENPDLILDLKSTILKIEVFTDSNKLVRKFALRNPSKRSSFGISTISK
jgi:hypothetical protein